MTTRVSPSFSGALRTFSYWVANGTLGQPVLDEVDYNFVLSDEPSALERVYAIFANVIEMDDEGNLLNARSTPNGELRNGCGLISTRTTAPCPHLKTGRYNRTPHRLEKIPLAPRGYDRRTHGAL